MTWEGGAAGVGGRMGPTNSVMAVATKTSSKTGLISIIVHASRERCRLMGTRSRNPVPLVYAEEEGRENCIQYQPLRLKTENCLVGRCGSSCDETKSRLNVFCFYH